MEFKKIKELAEKEVYKTLKGQKLKDVVGLLKKTNTFKDVEEFVITECPIIEVGDKLISTVAIKLDENIRFGKKCYLYGISLTPEVYDPEKMGEPVKNNASILPTMCSDGDLEPYREIRIRVSSERLQDGTVNKENELKELFSDILENPESYMFKGDRGIIVFGVFEEIENLETNEKTIKEIKNPVLEKNQMNYRQVFYMKSKKKDNGLFNFSLKTTQIHKDLEEKFKKTFKEGIPNEEEVNLFLKNNQ